MRLVCDCEQWPCPMALDLRMAVFWGMRDLLKDHKPSPPLPGQPSRLCLAWEVDSALQREFKTNTYMDDQAVHFHHLTL